MVSGTVAIPAVSGVLANSPRASARSDVEIDAVEHRLGPEGLPQPGGRDR
jgi:hypothetical protein